jgi:hypothetical protein
MTATTADLIAGYLAELGTGLRVPADEAELILAEAEDHLRATAAAKLETGLTELEAQQAAVASFGPARDVARAHRRRAVTAGKAAMAAWKVGALLVTTVGAGGIAGMGIFTYLLRSAPPGMGMESLLPLPPVVIVYAAMVAGGVVMLATRRLVRRRATGRDPLSPGLAAGCFLLASAMLWLFAFPLRPVPATPAPPPDLSCPYSCNWSSGPAPVPDLGPAWTALAIYTAMAVGGLVLLIARRRARRGSPGRDPLLPAALSPETTRTWFLLASAPLLALVVRGVPLTITPPMSASWLTPVSQGSVSAAPLVSGAVVTACLAVAVGYGLAAALRRARRGPALRRILNQADRDGAGRAYA